MAKSIDELLKENTDLIQKNYDFATEIHELKLGLIACEKRVSILEDAVAKLTEIVLSQEARIQNLEGTILLMQKQIDEMKN
jgi:predicted nuclease with TOPRIM domain